MTNITTLPNRHTSRIRPSHRHNMLLLDHWRQLHENHSMPARQHLDLRVMAPALAHVGLVEKRDGKHVWRLAGSALCSTPQGELTGREVLAGWQRFERQTLTRLFDRISGNGRPAIVRMSFNNGGYNGEMLILPLLDAATGEMLLMISIIPMHHPDDLRYIDLPGAELTAVRILPLPPAAIATARQQAEAAAPPPANRRGPFTVIEGGQ